MNAQERERRFWDGWYEHRDGLNQAMRLLQYEHQQRYIPFLNKWNIGFCVPCESVIEIGCGPCGLSPWLGRNRVTGIEPLSDFHRSKGVIYESIGYTDVYGMTAQEYVERVWKGKKYDLLVSCNVLDHDPDTEGFLSAMAKLSDRLFLAYDLRHTATEMHPGITADMQTPAGFRIINESALPAICDAHEINGTRIVLMERA